MGKYMISWPYPIGVSKRIDVQGLGRGTLITTILHHINGIVNPNYIQDNIDIVPDIVILKSL